MALLNEEELHRYQRQITLPEFGLAGQSRLKQASVLIVGMGGLGTPAAQYLAAAGVGRLGLLDDDRVELHNLQRQILYTQADIDRLKVECAAERLAAMNPAVEIVRHPVRLSAENVADCIADYDLVLDGTDHIGTRQVLNQACVLARKPLIYGALFRLDGVVSVFCGPSDDAPCYACLHGTGNPDAAVAMDCNAGGVLGVLPGMIGVLQATEAIKVLAGVGRFLEGRLLQYDALTMRTREFRIPRDPDCAVCGSAAPTLPAEAVRTRSGDTMRPSPAKQREARAVPSEAAASRTAGAGGIQQMSVHELKLRLDQAGDARSGLRIIDVREAHELELGHLAGVIHIPLGQLAARLNELESGTEYAVVCKAGGRSARAADILATAGFARIHNVVGGMNAWAREIDPSLPEY